MGREGGGDDVRAPTARTATGPKTRKYPVITLNNVPPPHHRHTFTLQNDVVEVYGQKMDMNGGMGTMRHKYGVNINLLIEL